jgi:predicted regulator of Ras-like GTPase activity (Roadblock/LC7/MglB family)
MGDGLVVAAQLPAGLKGETVAAFLPQIFGRVSQSAGEMQLGPLSSVVLAAGQGRCAIYKTGKLYLAALGHPGAALPEAMLGRIAAEIAKRNP